MGLLLTMAAAAVVAAAPRASAQPGGALKEVAFDQNLNAQLPLTTAFRDENGQEVRLADYFGKRPVILVMGYTNCPLLCSQVLGEVTRSLKPLDASIGKDFDIVTVSINPKETPEQADGQRRNYLKRYNRPGAESGWHALTGDEASIARLAKVVGFRYTYSAKLNLYAHAAGFVLLTPAGRISRYFYGVEYPARELKYALIEASSSKIGSPIDKLVMYCYDYDPATGKYTFAIMNTIRVFGVATALALGTFMFAMVRRDRRMARATRAANPELPPGPAIP
jgi:protein SCO1/2